MDSLEFIATPKETAADSQDFCARVAQGRLSGLASISLSSLEKRYWLFKDGKVVHGYRVFSGRVERVPAEEIEGLPPIAITFRQLPGRVLQFSKILLEHAGEGASQILATKDLTTLIQSYKKEPTATLVHVLWKDVEGFILVAGGNLPFQQAVFMKSGLVIENMEAITAMTLVDAPECRVVIYAGTIESEAWLETHLNVLFEWSVGTLLERYGYLTGKTMVGSVTRDLGIQAARAGRDLTCSGTMLLDRTLFVSPAEMAEAYKATIQLAMRHIHSVIGLGMATIITRQMLNFLNNIYRTLSQRYGLFD